MRPLIKVDCTTLPPGLMESELFGHQKGAFTGAHESKPGRLELANGGTIFLDEIGELPIELQAKLLRVIEEGEFTRLGSTQERKTNARVIAATNRDLKSEVSEGRFRADLYYRLGVFPIESPPLRDRREDIPLLVSFFVSKYADALGKGIRRIASSSMEALMAYDWPGNIRELRNVVERAVILGSGDVLRMEETLGDAVPPAGEPSGSLKRDLHVVERATILRALEESDWRVKGAGNAASRLGLSPSTLRSRMARLGIQRIERRQRAARPEAKG
jgi:transcriptional regulator with GAF, ATPase, and Fis domain